MEDKLFQTFNIPSLPTVVNECLSQLYLREANFDYICQLMMRDVAIVSSILKLANSVAFSPGKITSDLKTGMIRIGLTSVIQIIVSQSIENIFSFMPIDFFNMPDFLEHSAMVSKIAFEIGKILYLQDIPDLVVGGLFHDIGLLVRTYNDKILMKKIISKCATEKLDFEAAENALGVVGHNILGSSLLKMWNMPHNVQVLVHNHDILQEKRASGLTDEQHKLINILRLSDLIAHRFGKSFPNYMRNTYINNYELDKIGITSIHIKNILKKYQYT